MGIHVCVHGCKCFVYGCMCIMCTAVCVYVCIMCMGVCVHVHVRIWVYECKSIRTMYVCMRVWVYGCMCVWMYVYMGAWVYVCMSVWEYEFMCLWQYQSPSVCADNPGLIQITLVAQNHLVHIWWRILWSPSHKYIILIQRIHAELEIICSANLSKHRKFVLPLLDFDRTFNKL